MPVLIRGGISAGYRSKSTWMIGMLVAEGRKYVGSFVGLGFLGLFQLELGYVSTSLYRTRHGYPGWHGRSLRVGPQQSFVPLHA